MRGFCRRRAAPRRYRRQFAVEVFRNVERHSFRLIVHATKSFLLRNVVYRGRKILGGDHSSSGAFAQPEQFENYSETGIKRPWRNQPVE